MTRELPLVEPPWGAQMGIYFGMMGVASGLTLLFWWIRPRDIEAANRFEWISGWIALGALGVACLIVVVDLGRIERFFLMVTSFKNLGSPMSVGAKLIAAKMFLLSLYLYLLYLRQKAHSAGDTVLAGGATAFTFRVVPALLGMVSFGLAIYPATLLSRTWLSPLATSPAASVICLGTALLMGSSIATIVAHVVPGIVDDAFRARMSRMLLFLVCIESLLLLFEGLALHGNQPALARALASLMTGDSSAAFWGASVVLGLALPSVGLVAGSRHRPATVASAAAAFIGAGVTRYLFFAVR